MPEVETYKGEHIKARSTFLLVQPINTTRLEHNIMGKWIESMAKKARESKLAREERYRALGIVGKEDTETSAVDAVDGFYRSGGLRQRGGFSPPSQVIFCDSPLSVCLSIRAVQELRDGTVAKTVWDRIKKDVAGSVKDTAWVSSQEVVSKVDLNSIKQSKFASIVEDKYLLIHYVGKTIECESVKNLYKRKWHHVRTRRVGSTLTERIESILGKEFRQIIDSCIDAWVVVNQSAFDRYLHGTCPQAADHEDNEYFPDDFSDHNEEMAQQRDYGLFAVHQRCHLLFPAEDICFVSRKPAFVDTCSTKRFVQYDDGFGF